jgi:4-hydroxyphenylacetate 3-monooxygenase
MVADRDAIAEWARVSYGWIGRSPDYKAAFLATLGANSSFYEPYEENAKRWYTRVQEEVSFVNHAIVNPPVDRDRPLDEVKDVYMHVWTRPTRVWWSAAPRSSRRRRASRT